MQANRKSIESDFRTQTAVAAAADNAAQAASQAAAASNAVVNSAVIAARADEQRRLLASHAAIPVLVAKLTPESDDGVFVAAFGKDGKPSASKDGLQIKGHIERELIKLTDEQSLTILTQYDRASATLTAACGSYIIGAMQSSRGVEDAATATDLWKAVKLGIEASLNIHGINQFPASWQQYFTQIKGYFLAGGVVTDLTYVNSEGAECIRSIRWLQSERKRLAPTKPTTLDERVSGSLSTALTAALGGEDGTGELANPMAMAVTTEQAKFLLEVAESTLGSSRCRDLVTHTEEPVERILARLLSEYSKTDLVAMIEDFA